VWGNPVSIDRITSWPDSEPIEVPLRELTKTGATLRLAELPGDATRGDFVVRNQVTSTGREGGVFVGGAELDRRAEAAEKLEAAPIWSCPFESFRGEYADKKGGGVKNPKGV